MFFEFRCSMNFCFVILKKETLSPTLFLWLRVVKLSCNMTSRIGPTSFIPHIFNLFFFVLNEKTSFTLTLVSFKTFTSIRDNLTYTPKSFQQSRMYLQIT